MDEYGTLRERLLAITLKMNDISKKLTELSHQALLFSVEIEELKNETAKSYVRMEKNRNKDK